MSNDVAIITRKNHVLPVIFSAALFLFACTSFNFFSNEPEHTGVATSTLMPVAFRTPLPTEATATKISPTPSRVSNQTPESVASQTTTPTPAQTSDPVTPVTTVTPISTRTGTTPSSSAPAQNTPVIVTPSSQTDELLPAPAPVAPDDGMVFSNLVDAAQVVLKWETVKPSLSQDELYLISIDFNYQGQVYTDYAWTQQANWSLGEHSYLGTLSDDGLFKWSVILIRQTGANKDGVPQGDALSQRSQQRSFVWQPPSSGGGGNNNDNSNSNSNSNSNNNNSNNNDNNDGGGYP